MQVGEGRRARPDHALGRRTWSGGAQDGTEVGGGWRGRAGVNALAIDDQGHNARDGSDGEGTWRWRQARCTTGRVWSTCSKQGKQGVSSLARNSQAMEGACCQRGGDAATGGRGTAGSGSGAATSWAPGGRAAGWSGWAAMNGILVLCRERG